MPDSLVGALQERVAKLEQRADDLASRAIERFGDLALAISGARTEMAEDMKVFGPMLQDHAAMRADMRHLAEDVAKVVNGLETLEVRFDRERDERIKGQAERKQELDAAIEARNLEMNKLAAGNRRAVIAFMGVFVTALAGVVIQLLNHGGHP